MARSAELPMPRTMSAAAYQGRGSSTAPTSVATVRPDRVFADVASASLGPAGPSPTITSRTRSSAGSAETASIAFTSPSPLSCSASRETTTTRRSSAGAHLGARVGQRRVRAVQLEVHRRLEGVHHRPAPALRLGDLLGADGEGYVGGDERRNAHRHDRADRDRAQAQERSGVGLQDRRPLPAVHELGAVPGDDVDERLHRRGRRPDPGTQRRRLEHHARRADRSTSSPSGGPNTTTS